MDLQKGMEPQNGSPRMEPTVCNAYDEYLPLCTLTTSRLRRSLRDSFFLGKELGPDSGLYHANA